MEKVCENFDFSNIKQLQEKNLPFLCESLREKIICAIKQNGGHLSSNLGIVETIVAIHYVFDLPKDKVVFDVGHQAYAHKILSNRDIFTIRKNGGISGFQKRGESEYDTFTTGHAGTSIANSLGLAKARDEGKDNFNIINIVGDGSLFNGLNLEALTTLEKKPKNFIVILNDNGMSISPSVNGFYKSLSKGTIKKTYVKSKKAFRKVFGEKIAKFFARFKNLVKRIFNKNEIFERFGFKYVGIIDGNNVKEMVSVLKKVKELSKDKAVLVHVKTQKGKGLPEAEKDSDIYHGVGKALEVTSSGFSNALGDSLEKIIKANNKVIAITAAMQDGTGLSKIANNFANNFVDVGIAEEFAVSYSAGLAVGGYKPVVCIYSTFLQRAYDQILHDVCISNLGVVFCIDRAGLVGADGETHQGAFDISYLSHLPNMKIIAPISTKELDASINYALSLNSPVAIRYPKGDGIEGHEVLPFEDGLWQTLKEGEGIAILCVGPNMVNLARKIEKQLGVNCKIINARTIKPLDTKVLEEIKDCLIVTLEENVKIGGFGSLVNNYMQEKYQNYNVMAFGIEDTFVGLGTCSEQLLECGLEEKQICQKIREKFN